MSRKSRIIDLLLQEKTSLRQTYKNPLNPAAKINNCNALCTSRCISKRLPGLERISVARDVQDVSEHPRRVIAGNVLALDTQEPSILQDQKLQRSLRITMHFEKEHPASSASVSRTSRSLSRILETCQCRKRNTTLCYYMTNSSCCWKVGCQGHRRGGLGSGSACFNRVSVPSVARTTMESTLATLRAGPWLQTLESMHDALWLEASSFMGLFFQSAFATFRSRDHGNHGGHGGQQKSTGLTHTTAPPH